MTLSERIGQVLEQARKFAQPRQVVQLIRRVADDAWASLPAGGEATSGAGGGAVCGSAPPTPPKPRDLVSPRSELDLFEILGADLAPFSLFAHSPAREYGGNLNRLEMGLGV